MKDHPLCGGVNWRLVIAGAAVVVALCWQAAAVEYVHEDVRISGQEVFTFTDADQAVTVVVGDFRMTVGERTLSGRDAVVWIETTMVGATPHHDIKVYIEGDAQVTEPSGATTTDKTMLVTVHTDGRIRTAEQVVERDLKDFPLYQRAVEARKAAESPPALPGPAAAPGPSSAPAAGEMPPPVEPSAVSEPAAREAAAVGPERPALREQPPKPSPPSPPQVVDFHYDHLTYTHTGEGEQAEPVVILRGHVRITMGSPESELFLELSSDSAVVFLRKAERGAERESRTLMRGLRLPSLEAGLELYGVYLEGDVVISRGERTFRAPAAYYDLAADRAIVVDVVFHSVQEQRNIPIYVRAREARLLSAREIHFRHAKVSSSEFYTPSYHIGASTAYLMDTTPYDEKGERLGPQSWQAELKNVTFNVANVPFLYWPYEKTDFTQGHTALRRIQVGRNGNYGFGVETQWNLFRLLGVLAPEGHSAKLELDWYERGGFGGVEGDYTRPNYSGYWLAYGLLDRRKKDDFGTEREGIKAPPERGWLLMRHKQILPENWELQFELSYLCDRNFLEAFFPAEFFSGKEQETLVYVKKQQDNWALTGLLQYRLNRFDTQTESWPEVAGYLIGQPLLADKATLFSEARAGAKRWRPDNAAKLDDSDVFARFDTRDELDLPEHLGPVNLVSYATGRATYWSDAPYADSQCRPYGQIGQRINTHVWRVYDGVHSDLWDLNQLKHIITPEATVFASDTGGVGPDDVYPIEGGIEQHLMRLGGAGFGVRQRLQTKRGGPGQQRIVDWMRLAITAGFFDDDGQDRRTSGGDFFWYRPEYSLPRDFVNGQYEWQISDTTLLLSDVNYDTQRGVMGQASTSLAVQRDPRLRYLIGWRYLKDLDSSLATFGFNYKISRKYSFSFFEQYDMDFDGGRNVATSLSIVRQLPRWFAAVTVTYIGGRAEGNDIGIMLTLWPEGVPEFRLGGPAMSLLSSSRRN